LWRFMDAVPVFFFEDLTGRLFRPEDIAAISRGT
jgi:hypothetical protein